MKNLLAIAVAIVTAAALADVTVSNRVVMVDQNGSINAPEVLATTAQLATNEVRIIAAAESARVAELTATEATNAVQDVVTAIVNNNVVVYRSAFNDSFGTVVAISADCKCMVYRFVPGNEVGGMRTHDIYYCLTEDIGGLKPIVRANDTLTAINEDASIVADANVTEPTIQNTTFEDADGNVYSYCYKISVTVPSAGQYFFRIRVEASAPSGDGYTFDIKNGIKDGVTDTVTWGNKTLTFKGGLLMGVE